MKIALILIWLFLAAPWSIALDPFHPPEQWDEYQQRILKERAHEQPVWQRPTPGTSAVVAIQTLILPDFEVKEATIAEAFDAWQQACEKCGLKVRVYLEPAMLGNRQLITHSAKREPAARALSNLGGMSYARTKVVNDQLLVGSSNDLDPHELHVRVWALSEEAGRLLGLHKATPSNGAWCDVDASLKKNGAAVPQGTYADYNRELRALVAINTSVTLDVLSELIKETEAEVTVRQFKDKGVVQMNGYSLEVRSHQLQKQNAARIHARMRDSNDRLLPFAVSTESWAKSRGFVTPAGAAAWLDHKTSTLWLRSAPEYLDEFVMLLQKKDQQP